MVSYANDNKCITLIIGVLILIVVDNGIVPVAYIQCAPTDISLNPCCSGQWYRTSESKRSTANKSMS